MLESYLRSMTAYGRGMAIFSHGCFTIEIQSVNRRYLEVKVSVPRLLMRYEMAIRKQVEQRLGRGMVNVYLSWRNEGKAPVKVVANLSLARGLKQAWEQLAHEIGIESAIDLKLLAREKDLLFYDEEIDDERVYYEAIEVALMQALDHLIVMRQKEGERLICDFRARIITIEKIIDTIETQITGAVEKYRQKLVKRLEELFSGSIENEERILREVAIFAERVDITEEIVRFKSHLQHLVCLLETPLKSEIETRGKTLDFLIQELNREANTIGSKAADKKIAQQVIAVKSEVEKMREQVQNIE